MRTLLHIPLALSILSLSSASASSAPSPSQPDPHDLYQAALSRLAAVAPAPSSPPRPPTYFPELELDDGICFNDLWWQMNAPWTCAIGGEAAAREAEEAAAVRADEQAPGREAEAGSDATDAPGTAVPPADSAPTDAHLPDTLVANASDTANATDGRNASDIPFESFEDWKRRRAAPDAAPENASEPAPPPPPPESESSAPAPPPPPPPSAPPRPKGHRYNYASPDCSARVLASSPLTQHASSLLHKSKDRYMLTPCRADEHWAVVELCDEIRVEAVELAVWEFFSGIVRSVRVSVADDADGEWAVVAEFVGKNVRGAQTFTLPEPTSFHRFLRLDFPSFYGSEYYCPVSQLKVYGMNQMEAFKMEQRRAAEASGEAEKRARESEREAERVAEAVRVAEREARQKEADERHQRELCELERLVQEQARRVSGVENIFEPLIECAPSPSPASTSPAASPSSSSAPPADEAAPDSSVAQDPPPGVAGAPPHPPTPPEPGTTAYRGRTDTSESIYAFITRRLNALEGNTTLVARYIDEQGKALRAALERAEQRWGEERARDSAWYDVDRMRQEDRLARLLAQVDGLRAAFDAERRSTETQLQLLADELGFERRRSLAQLVVLVSIIVLGALSRGEAIDALLRPLSGDAVRRRRETAAVAFAAGDTRAAARPKRLSTGPLAGLLIDVAPPDGEPRSPTSPATPRGKRRSLPPGMRRRTPGTRSISAGVGDPGVYFEMEASDASPRLQPSPAGHSPGHGHPVHLSPGHASHANHAGHGGHAASPARRLPASAFAPRPRRLARSSHLHAMRRREGSASEAERPDAPTPTPRPRFDRLESHGASGGDEGSTSEVEEVVSSDEEVGRVRARGGVGVPVSPRAGAAGNGSAGQREWVDGGRERDQRDPRAGRDGRGDDDVALARSL